MYALKSTYTIKLDQQYSCKLTKTKKDIHPNYYVCFYV
jgi:hypothetical protein